MDLSPIKIYIQIYYLRLHRLGLNVYNYLIYYYVICDKDKLNRQLILFRLLKKIFFL